MSCNLCNSDEYYATPALNNSITFRIMNPEEVRDPEGMQSW